MNIPEDIMAAIKSYAESDYPNETVGLLLGKSDTVKMAMKLSNSAKYPKSYSVAPIDALYAIESAEQLGLGVIGIYHSHPDCSPDPSPMDTKWAIPGYTYLIASVEGGVVTETKAWKF